MKEKQFMRCICCGGLTLSRLKGWWIHKKCRRELEAYLFAWKQMRVILKLELLDWRKALTLLINGDFKGTDEYNKSLEKQALDAFTAKYELPSWVKQP